MLCGLYYKHMLIVNYASSIINKLKALLTDNAGVIIYDNHVFIVQATGYVCQTVWPWKAFFNVNEEDLYYKSFMIVNYDRKVCSKLWHHLLTMLES